MSVNETLTTEPGTTLQPSDSRLSLDTEPSTSPSSRFPLCLDTQAQPETAWLYTFVQGGPEESFKSIYPVIPNCGFSFLKEAVKFDKEAETCFSMTLSKASDHVDPNATVYDYFPGSELQVIAPKDKHPSNWLRFVLFLSVGSNSNSGDQAKCRINTMLLHPVSLTCQITSPGYKNRTFLLDFNPGITDRFDVENMESRKNEQHVVYHAFVSSVDASWYYNFNSFLEIKAVDKVPTFQIKAVKATSDPSDMYYIPHYKELFTSYTLVSKLGEKHSCHSGVLCERSPYFERHSKTTGGLKEMKVSECNRATDLFLEYVYYPQKPLPPSQVFDEELDILTLAHKFEMADLIAIATDRVIAEVNKAASQSLWRLYEFIHPIKLEMQINWKLWKTLLINIRERILKPNSKTMDFNDPIHILNLVSFGILGGSGVPLLEKLCNDLGFIREGESEEELRLHLKVQDLITRFLIEVIKFEKFKTK